MNTGSLYHFLVLGFGLGLLHALDADHIMAVSAINNRAAWSAKRLLVFCSRWALGHGATLMALTALLIFAQFSLPDAIAVYAEKAIGMLLIALGGYVFWLMWQQKITLQLHTHKHLLMRTYGQLNNYSNNDGNNDITHTHLTHIHLTHTDNHRAHAAADNHPAVLVGVVHGLAGSAPILALIPATNHPYLGLAYAALFSLGVLIAMLMFGLLFGQCLGKLQTWAAVCGQGVAQISRAVIALLAISCGSYWLFSS